MNKERVCRECGCSYFNPCMNTITGNTCYWVAEDLCSFCAAKEMTGGDMDLLNEECEDCDEDYDLDEDEDEEDYLS